MTVKRGSPEHIAMVKEWYGPNGTLAESGFHDIEKIDEHGNARIDGLYDGAKDKGKLEFQEGRGQSIGDLPQAVMKYHQMFLRNAETIVSLPKYEQEEWAISLLIGEGWLIKDVAASLDMSVSTVRRRIRGIERKLGIG